MELDRALVEQAAAQHGVDPDILVELLELSNEFPDMAAWGAKSRLFNRVSEIIESGVEQEDDAE